jgi:hypothetical protein
MKQDYIAKNLCVEKNVEGSSCKGCCQLKKRLNEQQEQKKELPSEENSKQNINFCMHLGSSKSGNFVAQNIFLIKPGLIYSFSFIHTIFHPPQSCTFS